MGTNLSKAGLWVADLPARIAVLCRSVVTYATLGATLCTLVATTLAASWPAGAQVALAAAGFLTAVVVAVRRVTPVEDHERGVLPPDAGQAQLGALLWFLVGAGAMFVLLELTRTCPT